MSENEFNYSVAIRTLGTAGTKYQSLLDSLMLQTVLPQNIFVYIAEGYPIPKETVGIEQYIYVKKGMVAQRALPYDEIDSEYILFLDDDVYLPPESVELMYKQLQENNADVISPDVFPNAQRSLASSLMMTISGRMRARRNDDIWGYKVMRTAGYSYNARPVKDVYWSQTNAGPCFLCLKSTMLNIHFEEELWLDNLSYAQGDDQVMFYKMYINGYKQLTTYSSGILHLDAGGNRNPEKEKMLIYSDFRFKTIFWHRYIYSAHNNVMDKFWDCLSIIYAFTFAVLISVLKFRFDILKLKCSAIRDGIRFIKSEEYKSLHKVI